MKSSTKFGSVFRQYSERECMFTWNTQLKA